MTAHVSAEHLSAYLDHELATSEAQELEEHLESCPECSARLEGMRRVVSSLGHLERMAPSSTLDQLVMRRVALAGEQKNWLDRLESSLPSYQRQSNMLALFSVVIALALIVFSFLYALKIRQNGVIEVRFDDPAWESVGEPSEVTHLSVGDLAFELHGERWIEEGLDPAAEARIVERGTPEASELTKLHPTLEPLLELERPTVLRLGDQVIELR